MENENVVEVSHCLLGCVLGRKNALYAEIENVFVVECNEVYVL